MSEASQQIRAKWAELLLAGLMVAILLLAAALRFHRLGAQSLWHDEAVSYAHTLRPASEVIQLAQHDLHPPGYFLLLGWWQDFAGSSEFALRLLSAFCSLVSIAFVYAIGRRLCHPAVGIVAAAILALNSLSIYYAQEARMYALMTAVAGASAYVYIHLMRNGGRWRGIIGLGIVNALGLYTQVLYSLVVLAQLAHACALWLLERRSGGARRAWRLLFSLLCAGLLTAFLFLPWLPVSARQVFARPNFEKHLTMPLPADQALGQIVSAFAFGSAADLLLCPLALVVVGCSLLALFAWLWRCGGFGSALFPLIWLLISVAAYLSLSLSERYLRFLLPAQLAFAVLLGYGYWILWSWNTHWTRLASAIAKTVAASAFVALLLSQASSLQRLYHHPDFQRDDMRGLVAGIEADLHKNDAIIVSAPGLEELLRYYYSADAPVYPLPSTSDAEETRAQVKAIIDSYERLHVIFYGAAEQDPHLVVEATLNSEAFELSDSWIDDLRYLKYISPAALNEKQTVDLIFGDEILLRAFALSDREIQPGETLLAQFEWSAIARPARRYKVFLQLLNADGALVAQRDSEPSAGSAPTTSWQPNDTISDNHALQIPAHLPAADYKLIAGLYDASDPFARLPAAGATYVELGMITLE